MTTKTTAAARPAAKARAGAVTMMGGVPAVRAPRVPRVFKAPKPRKVAPAFSPVELNVRLADAARRLATSGGRSDAAARDLVALLWRQMPERARRDGLVRGIWPVAAQVLTARTPAQVRRARGALVAWVGAQVARSLAPMDRIAPPRAALTALAADTQRVAALGVALARLPAVRLQDAASVDGVFGPLLDGFGVDPATRAVIEGAFATILPMFSVGFSTGMSLGGGPGGQRVGGGPSLVPFVPAAAPATVVAVQNVTAPAFPFAAWPMSDAGADALCRAALDADVTRTIVLSAALMAAGEVALREDFVRAACEPDAARRARLADALRERLAVARGLGRGDNMIELDAAVTASLRGEMVIAGIGGAMDLRGDEGDDRAAAATAPQEGSTDP